MIIKEELFLEEEVELVNKIAKEENISDWFEACDCCGRVSICGIRTHLPDAIGILFSEMKRFKNEEYKLNKKEKELLAELLYMAESLYGYSINNNPKGFERNIIK